MAKRKKHPKLPNGYGSIRYLGSNRRNPYAVHPPTTEFTPEGCPLTPKALCYINDWYKGFAILTAYKAGKYYPGYENTLADEVSVSDSDFVNRILADYSMTKNVDERDKVYKKTFADIYKEFYEWKFEKDKSKTFSKGTMDYYKSAYNNCTDLHNRIFAELRHNDLQSAIDDLDLGFGSKSQLSMLFKQMYKYAEIYELCDKNYAAHVKVNVSNDAEHGIPFTDNEMKTLWENKENPIAGLLLIMCYSGFRISELKTLSIDLEQMYFKGGIKTDAGKNRIVPMHNGISDLVKTRLQKENVFYDCDNGTFRRHMYSFLESVGIEKHTPHDCRHTFSMLCERYNVNENDRKRLLGHSFGKDITNGIYGHRSLEDLRAEVEKIKICY